MRSARHLCGMIAALLLIASALPVVAQGERAADLYEQPVLVLNPGMHTGPIIRADTDAGGRYAVTGADDKTVRVWSLKDGRLLRTIPIPRGPGHLGKIYAVAISPDGETIAAGGWTTADKEQIYLFERQSGSLVRRVEGLPNVVLHLAFSPDGRFLAATLGGAHGLRVYDREWNWSEVARDPDYGDHSYGVAFARDGRLATTSYDGRVRLYDRNFALVERVETGRGSEPFGIAFSPDGSTIAVGFNDSTAVELLDGRTLEPPPDTADIDNLYLSTIAWSSDGRTLYAGGRYEDGTRVNPVVAWIGDERRKLPAGTDTIMSLVPLPDGALLVAAADPYLAVLQPDGSERWAHPPPKADFREQKRELAISDDGNIVDFGYEYGGEVAARFDVSALTLTGDPPDDARTAAPVQDTLRVEAWDDGYDPTLDGERLPLKPYERARSLAIHPDGRRFVLGTEWRLRAFDDAGEELWRQDGPGVAWAVNITGDGRLVVAAYGDGTIRWHRMDDGREILALFPMIDRRNWVAWTPEGVYAATAGSHGTLRWHVNRGWDQPGETIPVSEIPETRRPEVIKLVPQEMGTAGAIAVAELTKIRDAIQGRLRSARPGARLHVLTIGISDYEAKHLRLNFADDDARDIASALENTQSSLYADVSRQVLRDGDAEKSGILRGLQTMRTNMAASGKGRDLAVVHFSGHGAMVGDTFYLLPHEVDARDPVGIASSALSVTQFREQLQGLAQHGRVLVLLDACHSGAIADGTPFEVDARVLRTALAGANITVLTSSQGEEYSREHELWNNGAFTEVFLDALSSRADTNRNGMISVNELVTHLDDHVPRMTEGEQNPGREVRYGGDLFVAGL